MKKLIVALLATGLMGSAFAQSTPSQTDTSATTSAVTPSVPGAKKARTQSLGDMKPFYIVLGATAVAAVAIAAGSSGKKSGTTGTTN